MTAPGVAAQETPECQPATFPGAVFFDGFHSISAAGGRVAAFGTQQR